MTAYSHLRFRMVVAARRVALTLLLVAPPAAALEFDVNYANADTRRWSCRLCGFDKVVGHTGTVSVGGIESKRGEARFGRDNGIDRAGDYMDLNADYRQGTAAGSVLEFAGRNLGLDSRDAALRVRKPRRYGVQVRHRGIPRNLAADGRTPFSGTETLSLPDRWVPAWTTDAMTQLVTSSGSVKMATQRSRSEVEGWLSLAPGLTFRAELFRADKRGVEQAFRDAFYRATALPQPIDYRVDGADVGLYYESRVLSLAISRTGRQFNNGQDAFTWRSPYPGGTAFGRSATAPDNEAGSLSVVSRVRIGGRTIVNATLVRGEARQDVPFLPPTTNASIELEPLDAPSLAAERESRSAAVRLVSRPTERLQIGIAHAVNDQRDKRQPIAVMPVLGDLFATPTVAAKGYDYKRAKTDLSLRYRMPRRLRVATGFRRVETHRSNLEIDANAESRVWVEVTGEIADGWRVRTRHSRAERNASEFAANTLNNPLTRRYYQAERHDAVWSAGLGFDSNATGFSIGLDANYREHDYPGSPLGLQRDAGTGWLMDIGYAGWSAVSLSGFFGEQNRESKTVGTAKFPTLDWQYDTEDTVTTAGARLRASKFLHRALELTVDYAYSNGIGDYATTLDDSRSSFPRLISHHRSVDTRLHYRWRPRTTVVLRHYFERYRAADWAIDGIGQDGIRNVLTFGRSSPKYGNHLVALSIEARL